MWRTCSNIRIKQNFKIVADNYISHQNSIKKIENIRPS